ncbi:MAG: LysR substrate-binding domain-containing protein [Salinarimonas sp.]
MRRRLLPLSALRAFEVAARRGSIKEAARELGVTDSAISRKVGDLETLVGGALFVRSGRGLKLTEAGAELSVALTSALDAISASLEVAKENVGAGSAVHLGPRRTLRIKAVTTLAARILLPRIGAFERAHPGMEIVLSVAETTGTAVTDQVDLVLSYTREAPAERAHVLLRDEAEPLASSQTVELLGADLRPARLLRRARLLGATPTWWDWRAWAQAQRVAWPPAVSLMTFETDDLAIQAAVAGAGIVLADPRLAGRDLAEGRLMRVLPRCQPTPMGWYVASERGPGDEASAAFLAWLRGSLDEPVADAPL